MDDATGVGRFEGVGQLSDDGERLGEGHRPVLQPFGERRPVDQFQHQHSQAVHLLDVVDRGDVGVLERGERARFPLEANEPLRVGGKGWRQNLKRDLATELRIAGAIDLTHASRAEHPGDFEAAEALPGLEGQGLAESRGPVKADGRVLEESAGGGVRGKQRSHLRPPLLVAVAGGRQEGFERVGRLLEGRLEQGANTREFVHRAHETCPCSSRNSHARACAQSRFTVIGATSSAAAVSSTVRPAKKRSSTSRL